LDNWFGTLKLNLLSERGIWVKPGTAQWQKIENINNDWKQDIRPVLDVYVDRTPGSFIVEKEYTLIWNYSRSEPELGSLRVSELKGVLFDLTSNLSINVIEGRKSLENTNTVIKKDSVLSPWLLKPDWQFILAIGHDSSSEDLFAVLPDFAYSIKVGFSISQARYFLPSPSRVRSLLLELSQS
jgi:trehalose 6-phosphate synthase/phosphatase